MTVLVMNVRCGECGAVYRVDPAKVPSAGIRARCARCSAIIDVGPVGLETPPAGTASTQSPAHETPIDHQSEPVPVEPPPPAQRIEESSIGRLPHDAPPFGSTNAEERARTLARALVSDITVYHRDRWERSLRSGKLRQDLGGEIRKSWEEYVGQVGNQIARETSYFQDALNEILARGARLF